ncbi:kelch-like protein 2, partial [Myzus persicae]|uniref:kelch-like protein 2 n=1 Tax=Myzus persicae TaxID=13164 RepID=UPI000B932D93
KYNNIKGTLKSVEAYRPSTGNMTSIADMQSPQERSGVVALEGLLYVVSERYEDDYLDSVEVYSTTVPSPIPGPF